MATNTIGALFEVDADPSKAKAAMEQFSDSTKGSMDKIDDSAKHSRSVWGEFFSFFRSHLIFSVDELMRLGRDMKEMAESSAEFGEQVHNLSEASGMTAEQVSGLMFAFKETGANADTLNRGLREMARNLSPLASSGSEGTKALKALGISAFDASGHMKPLHELLLEIAGAFHEIPDSTEKAAIAAAIFGTRVGEQMIPALDRGVKGIEQLEQLAHKLGVTLNDEDAEALEQQAEQLKIVDARWEGLKLRLSEYVLPGLIDIMSAVSGDTVALKILEKELFIAYDFYAEIVAKIAAFVAGIGTHGHDPLAHLFNSIAKNREKAITQQETDIDILRDQQKQMADLLNDQKGGGTLPDLKGGLTGKPIATHADALSNMLQREKEDVQAFADSQQSSMRQIDLAYERQIDSATKAIEADRQLLARKKITLAEEKREEQEYSDFLAFALKLRDAKWNEELDKIQARVQTISANITEQQKEAQDELRQSALALLPQGPQSNPLTNPAFLQSQKLLFNQFVVMVPPVKASTDVLVNFKNALQGIAPAIDDTAKKFPVMTKMSQDFSQAMGKNVAQAIIYGSSISQAMEKALKATIASIASKAIVQALYSTALGFLLLAEFDYSGAAQAFEAAAVFGAVGGAAAAVAAVIPGGARASRGAGTSRYGSHERAGGGSESGEEWQYGAMSSMAQTLAPGAQHTTHSGALTVSIMGDEQAGEWLATTLNRATTQQGVQLTSTSSQRGAPVGH